MASGTQVPWTDPGGTPCCCGEPSVGCSTGTGQFTLTRAQALAYKTGMAASVAVTFTGTLFQTSSSIQYQTYVRYPSGTMSNAGAGSATNSCTNSGAVTTSVANDAATLVYASNGAFLSGNFRTATLNSSFSVSVVEQGTDPDSKTFSLSVGMGAGASCDSCLWNTNGTAGGTAITPLAATYTNGIESFSESIPAAGYGTRFGATNIVATGTFVGSVTVSLLAP